jgi:hypothetical protein
MGRARGGAPAYSGQRAPTVKYCGKLVAQIFPQVVSGYCELTTRFTVTLCIRLVVVVVVAITVTG